MRGSRFNETQIVRILKEIEGGRVVKDVCREHGISETTYYNWKARYGGMEVSDVRRLKELDQENQRLKHMFAELGLERCFRFFVGRATVGTISVSTGFT